MEDIVLPFCSSFSRVTRAPLRAKSTVVSIGFLDLLRIDGRDNKSSGGIFVFVYRPVYSIVLLDSLKGFLTFPASWRSFCEGLLSLRLEGWLAEFILAF